MKNIKWLFVLLVAGCTKTEPIKIIEPLRQIDTKVLQAYKADLSKRKVSIGMLYGWGKKDESSLMHVPDSLDIVVIKDSIENLSEFQKIDLKDIREKKATKVLGSIDLNTKLLNFEILIDAEYEKKKTAKETEWAAMTTPPSDAEKKIALQQISREVLNAYKKTAEAELDTLSAKYSKIVSNGFDGISIEMPEKLTGVYSKEKLTAFVTQVRQFAGKDKPMLLIIENPFNELKTFSAQTNWMVFRQTVFPAFLMTFEAAAADWKDSRFVPSADFSVEDNAKGFSDAAIFTGGGKLSQVQELTYWTVANKAGVAFYHIEKDYTNIVGKRTHNALRNAIDQLQLNK